jgi:hypothetical protein
VRNQGLEMQFMWHFFYIQKIFVTGFPLGIQKLLRGFGCSQGCDGRQDQKSFRKLAREYHPDIFKEKDTVQELRWAVWKGLRSVML